MGAPHEITYEGISNERDTFRTARSGPMKGTRFGRMNKTHFGRMPGTSFGRMKGTRSAVAEKVRESTCPVLSMFHCANFLKKRHVVRAESRLFVLPNDCLGNAR